MRVLNGASPDPRYTTEKRGSSVQNWSAMCQPRTDSSAAFSVALGRITLSVRSLSGA